MTTLTIDDYEDDDDDKDDEWIKRNALMLDQMEIEMDERLVAEEGKRTR